MRSFISLLKVYLKTTFDLGTFIAWWKQGPKGVAKGVGAVILFLYVIGALGALLFLSSINTYIALKPFGLEAVILQSGVVSATVVVWVLGFITCLATYSLSGAESFLLSLPLGPRALFGAKFAMVYVTEAALAFLLIASSAGVYAFFESPGPLFYAEALLIAALTPLAPISLFYFILVPLMMAARFLRRRDAIVLIGGILGMGLALGWQLIYQRMMLNMNDPQWLLANLADPGSTLSKLASAYPPAAWAGKALSLGAGKDGLLNFLLFAAAQAAILGFALLILPGPYARSLTLFGETHVSKLKDSTSFIGRSFRMRSPFVSSLKREFLIMLREPAFLINGPFVVVLLPLIFSVMYLSMRDRLLADIPFLADPSSLSSMAIGAMAFSAFLGSITSIAATSISREGKQFAFVKSLPLPPLPYLGAKIVHALIYCAFAAFVGPFLLSLIVPLGMARCVLAGFAGFGISSFLNVAALALDTAAPRLDWPNPTVAIKQNPITAVAALGGMAFVGGISVLGAYLRDWPPFLPLVGVLGTGLAALGFRIYLPWAKKRIVAIE